MAEKIIIDTDPGIDDAMAIHLAFADPAVEVLGLTSIFGNVFVEQATRNALLLTEQASYDCFVAEGCQVPQIQPQNPPSHYVHGPEGFGNLPAAQPQAEKDPRPAHIAISETCRAHPGEVVLCPVGPLTNIAALLDYDPEITKFVKKLVIMGGSAYFGGNVTAHAEANIWNDPHAADKVFAADWEIEMIGLDVTSHIKCDLNDFTNLGKASPKIGGFLEEIVGFYIDFYETVVGERVCLMHDPAAVLSITRSDLFEYESVPIEVICEGEEVGRTVPVPEAARRPVKVAVASKIEAVRAAYLGLSARADQQAAIRRTQKLS